MSFSPVRLNHAVLFVADLERSVSFYETTFGMEVMAREPRANAAFLRLPRSGNHHDLGLFEVGAGAGPKRRGAIGLYHLAWQLDTIDELVEAHGVLRANGAYTGQSSHGATKSVYGADPDGNEFEIMWMLPREAWGEYESSAPSITSTWPVRCDAGPACTRHRESLKRTGASDEHLQVARCRHSGWRG
jgi:catechol-2,3-dioxygenase